MDTAFLEEMRQSNKCGTVRNDEIIDLYLRSGVGPWVSIPCLPQDSSHIYWFHPSKQSTRKKQSIQNWYPTFNKGIRCNQMYYSNYDQNVYFLVQPYWVKYFDDDTRGQDDFGWQCYQSWESHFSIAYFDLKILLFLVNTLITKFDDFISNWFLLKIYC